MKKTIALTAIASIFATSALAAGNFENSLFGADIRNNSGNYIGYVTKVNDNRSAMIIVNASSQRLDTPIMHLVPAGNGIQLILN